MPKITLNMEEVYADYYEKIRRYIFGKLQSKDDSEELVSEVFLKLCSKADSFDSTKASVSTWVYTITRNTVIDYYRTRKMHELLTDDISAEEENDLDDNLELLAEALEQLDERERDLIILHYYSGYTLKSIAEMVNVSYSYAKVIHNKALQELRKFMKGG